MVWRASADAARVARAIATEMYGAAPHHGYVYGGSGGGLRTIACIEHAPDLYDGAVPYIAGSTNGGVLPVTMSAVANALRLLWPKFDAIADACEPGGSGNPYDGLDAEQRDALAVLYRCGFPRGAEAQLADHGQALNIWAWDAPTLLRTDPGYFADFWTVPGYAGAGDALAAGVIEEKTQVRQVLTGHELASAVDVERAGVGRMMSVAGAGGADVPMAVVVDGVDEPIRMIGASLTFTSGAAAGRRLYCIGAVGGALMSSAISGPIYDGVAIGDEVVIDNRDWLAFCHYHRHQVRADNHATHQFVIDGKPVYPQRPPFPMAELRSTTRAGDHSGRFAGKMIVVQNTSDDYAWPHAGHMYGLLVRDALGATCRRPIPPLVQRPRRAPSRPADVDAPGELPRERRAGGARPRRVGRARDRAPVDHRLRVGPPRELAHARRRGGGASRHPARRHARRERWSACRGAGRRHRHLRGDRRGPARCGHAHLRRVGLRRLRRLAGRRRRRRRQRCERVALPIAYLRRYRVRTSPPSA